MNDFRQLMIDLGKISVPVMIALLALIICVFLVSFIIRRKRRNHKHNTYMSDEGGDEFCRVVLEGQQGAQLIIRRSDMYPVYATGNINKFAGVTLEQIRFDIERLGKFIPKSDWNKLWKEYIDWDGKEEFGITYKRTDNGLWYEISVTRCKEDMDYWSFRDVTEQKKIVEKLENKLADADTANQYKTSFLSKMSHEIRTPMNGIVGMLALAQANLKGEEQIKQYLDKAEALSKYLLSLINDILDMSRIEAGKIELENKAFDLIEFGERLRTLFQKNIEAKGVRFDVEYKDMDVRYVVGDELRIFQVMSNFLSNASKFTSEGEIIVTIKQMMKENGNVDFMLRVHDTGIGIAPDFLAHIFRPFEQESIGITKAYGGSGLGMAISDNIVRLMGGEIVVESKQGEGSDFAVFLKFPIAAKEDIEYDAEDNNDVKENDFSFDGRTILMAEDNEINAEIAVEMLGMRGAKVEIAPNGIEAVEMFEKHNPGYYDFILMDIQMPLMDGRSAAKKIRSMDREDAHTIPIFALSAEAFVEDERRSKEAGMNGHFTKPIDFDELETGIGNYMSKRSGDRI